MTGDEQKIGDVLGKLQITGGDVISIVFVGHVDAGKSTLGGQVLNKLGMIDKRTLEKYREQARERNRESWYLSWALDTDEGERERGKTAEVGRACFWLGDRKVVLLDAPGHSMYVSDMISGANQADIAVLVVSARKNEFEAGFEKDGQTREHIYLSRAGGVKSLIVLVNKMDDAGWEEERFRHIQQRLAPFLQRIYGSREVFYIPVSGTEGENVLERGDRCPWYHGEAFLELLKRIEISRQIEGPFSFVVLERVKNMGTTFYEGKVKGGRLRRSPAIVLPAGLETSVVEIYDVEDSEIDEAPAGDFVRVRISEDQGNVSEGDVIVEPGCQGFVASDEFSCALTISEARSIVSVGYQCVLHLGPCRKLCKVTALAAVVEGRVVKRRFAKRGERVLAKLKVEGPVVLRTGDGGVPMDTLALRSENLTVALGVVKKSNKK